MLLGRGSKLRALIAVSALLLASGALNCYLAFTLVDAGMELDQARSQQRHEEANREVMLHLIREQYQDLRESELRKIVADASQGEGFVSQQEEDGLLVGGLVFEIDDGRVVSVKLVN